MLFEPYVHGASRLHTMAPCCKVIFSIVFSVATALLHTTGNALCAFCIGSILLFLPQVPVFPLLRQLCFANIFIAFLWLFLPFSVIGTPFFTAGPLTASKEGIELALLITLKSNAILMGILVLVATTSITAIGQSLTTLHIPQKLILLLLFCWRYLHVIIEEYGRLHTAAKMRGFVAGTNRHTYRTYAHLVAMLLINSLNRAERIHNAMRLRGFTGSFHSLRPSPVSTRDTVLTFFACSLVLCLPIMEAFQLSSFVTLLANIVTD